jgi:hypothetical protein
MSAISAIFKPLRKVNNHPMGENSPYLVTMKTNFSNMSLPLGVKVRPWGRRKK